MPDEFAELREALIKFNQAVKFPPQTPNIVFGIIRETEKLLDAYDRLKSDHAEMVARNKLLRNRPDLPLERMTGYDEMISEIDRLKRERDHFLDLCVECNRDGDVWWIAGRPNEVYPMRDSAIAALLGEV